MADEESTDEKPTVAKLFDTVIVLADTCEHSLAANHETHLKVERLLNTFEKNHTDAIQKIDKQAVDLKAMYSPGRVLIVAEDARDVMKDFSSEAKSILDEIKKRTKTAGLKLYGYTLCVVVAVATITWIVLKEVPTPAQITERREGMVKATTEVENLTATAAKLKSQIDSLVGQVVSYNGEKWVRTDSLPRPLCLDGNRPDTCANYVRVR